MPDINVPEWGVNKLFLGTTDVNPSQWPNLSFSAADKAELKGSLHIAGTLTGTLGNSIVGTDQLKADLKAKLVTNGDNHDHSGGDGARLKHSLLELDGGRNPHGTTAADIQALPIAGGRITGDLQVSGSSVFYGKVGIGLIDDPANPANPTESLDVNGRVKSGSLTVGPFPADSRFVFFGVNTLRQDVQRNYALLQAVETHADFKMGQTYLNSPEDIRFRIGNLEKMILANNGNVGIGTTSPNAKLEVNGSIRSPMWNLTQVFNIEQSRLPLEGAFNSGGGMLVIFVSGSGFSVDGEMIIGMNIMVDNLLRGEAKRFTNEKLSHKTFGSNPLIVAGLARGPHTLSLLAQGDTQTDANDCFSATVLEFPW